VRPDAADFRHLTCNWYGAYKVIVDLGTKELAAGAHRDFTVKLNPPAGRLQDRLSGARRNEAT
jgi:hypothetical protein